MAGYEFIKYYRGSKIYNIKRPAEIRILLWLAENCSYDCVVITRYAFLAKQLGIQRRYVITCIQNLEKTGYIETRPEVGKHVAIWLKKGFGFGGINEEPKEPNNWNIHNYKQDEIELNTSSKSLQTAVSA